MGASTGEVSGGPPPVTTGEVEGEGESSADAMREKERREEDVLAQIQDVWMKRFSLCPSCFPFSYLPLPRSSDRFKSTVRAASC